MSVNAYRNSGRQACNNCGEMIHDKDINENPGLIRNSHSKRKESPATKYLPTNHLSLYAQARRKIRCDRAEPKCSRCERLNQPCSYDEKKKVGPEDVSRQISELQDRLAQAEARLAMSQQHNQQPVQLVSPGSRHQPQVQTNHGSSGSISTGSRDGTSNATYQSSDLDLTMDGYNVFNHSTAGAEDTGLLQPTLPNTPQLFWMGGFDQTSSIPSSLPHFANVPSLPGPDNSSSSSQPISTFDLATLHDNYFSTIYYSLPWLNQERFFAELASNTDSPPLLSLSYAVALIGSTLSSQYEHLQYPCYHMARRYAESSERDEEAGHLANLNLFQALLFIIRYEIRGRRPLRAWMTIGRAIRLSKILGLHQMDREVTGGSSLDELRIHLAPTDDDILLEERRRSFWGLYMSVNLTISILKPLCAQ